MEAKKKIDNGGQQNEQRYEKKCHCFVVANNLVGCLGFFVFSGCLLKAYLSHKLVVREAFQLNDRRVYLDFLGVFFFWLSLSIFVYHAGSFIAETGK